MQINGLAAIVTGGSSELGGAAACQPRREGQHYRSQVGEAHAKTFGGHFIKVDVTSEDFINAALAEAMHGKARLLVNCVGVATGARVVGRDCLATPLADFAKVVTINLVGTYNVFSKFAARIHDENVSAKKAA